MSGDSKKSPRLTTGAAFTRARPLGWAILADQRGVAAIELAMLAPTLLFLLMGIYDVGQMTYTAMQVRAAAHAGAQYV
jgi:Flp pilus assembly protein TadG